LGILQFGSLIVSRKKPFPDRLILVGAMSINTTTVLYDGMRQQLRKAVFKTNEVLRSSEFYAAIAACGAFDLADIAPADIAELLKYTALSVKVDVYYSISPIERIDGYDDPEQPRVVNLNLWHLNRPVESICNSLVHGCLHALNSIYPDFKFGHGDYHLAGKENTAPYRIGAVAEKLLSGGNVFEVEPLQHEQPLGRDVFTFPTHHRFLGRLATAMAS
jgi:hypothetical protein